MNDSIIGKNSFVCGTIHDSENTFLSVIIDEFAEKRVPHGILLHWQKGRLQKVAGVKWNIVSIAILAGPQSAVVAIGETGKVTLARPGSVSEEDVSIASTIGSIVPLRCSTAVAGVIYALGMRRQAYKRSIEGHWAAIHQGMLVPTNFETVLGFEAVVAVAADEIYAAGWEGEIWQFDGLNWRQLDSPTNLIFTSLAVGPDKNIYGCGQAGLLAVGRGNTWRLIESDLKIDFWSVVCFKDRIFVSSFQKLYELRESKLVEVGDAMSLTNTFHRLTACESALWSVGEKSVLSFDGSKWDRLI